MTRPAAILFLLMLPTLVSASGQTLRCGSKIVKTGMTKQEVLRYCGAPSSKEIEKHDVRSGNRVTGQTELHIWTYIRPSGQPPAILQFDVDKLIDIQTRK